MSEVIHQSPGTVPPGGKHVMPCCGRQTTDMEAGVLLTLRREQIVPHLAGTSGAKPAFSRVGARGLACAWQLGDGSRLGLLANLGPEPTRGFARPPGICLCAVPEEAAPDPFHGELPPWSAVWFLDALPGAGAE